MSHKPGLNEQLSESADTSATSSLIILLKFYKNIPFLKHPVSLRVAMPTKRSRTPQLISRPSELNAHVTLFEVAKVENAVEDASGDILRRSKRVRREVVKAEMCDLEDLGSPSPSPPPKTPKKKRATKVEEEGLSFSSTSKKFTSVSPAKKAVSTVKTETATPSKKRGSASAKKPVPKALSAPHPAPENWEETYATIKAMRARFVAPVDTMGCQMAQVAETDPKNRRYSTLVSLMLSSQTKDEVCHAAVNNLREAFGGSISLDAMLAADNAVIAKAIAKVGFWNKKTIYLKQAAIALRDNFNSDVPKTVDELCTLRGVGPKMAFLTLEMAWGVTDGIGVDVHVHRITNRLGWHSTGTTEQSRLNLQSWLPTKLYGDINHMMVGFGQVICLPTGPRCDMCDLSTKQLCPSARIVKNRKPIVFIKPNQDSPAKVEVAFEENVEENVKSTIKEEDEDTASLKGE